LLEHLFLNENQVKKISTFSKNFPHFWNMLKHVKITSKSRLKYGDIQLPQLADFTKS